MAVFPGKPPNPLGLKVELNLAGTWTDVTSFVLQRDMLQITNLGRIDESASIQASQLTLTLKNKDGRFTPKNASGAYFPNIARNTPIRVSVNATSQAPASVPYSGFRYYGEVSSWPPTSDISQHDVYVQIVASGIWRRISQSNATIGSSYSRYTAQLTGTSVPATSWTMEDGSGSLAFITQIGAGANMTFAGTPSFAQDGTSFPGSDALPQLNGARIPASVSSAATPTDNVCRFALAVPATGDSTASGKTTDVVTMLSPSATGMKRTDVYLIGNQLVIKGFAATTGGAALFTSTITTKVNGVPVLVSLELTPSGGSVNWALRIIKPGAAAVLDQVTGTQAGVTLAAVTGINVNSNGLLTDTTFGQLGVFYAVPSLVTAAAAIGGHAGEFAVVRFQRLCTEFSINSEVIGSTSAAMGPQTDDTLANLLQVIENTDGGLLYESTDQFGLGYRTLLSMQNQSVAVTLSYAAGALGAPLPATYDDQLLKNQWTVTNWDGYTALATLTSGALSIQPVPNGTGLYAGGPLTVSANTHAQVNAIAQQRLFQGTVDDVRYPQVSVNFKRGQVSSLFATVPALRVGDYIQITNLPAFDGGGTAKQLVYGWEETLNAFSWTQVFNTVPELPFETTFSPGVFSVVAAPQGSTPFGSQVGSSVSGSQIGGGVVGGTPTAALSARSIGGMTAFVSASTPFDWSFAVSGTPADVTYFICTQDQALPVTTGDTFTNSGGLGGPFTVTSLDPPSGGNVSVHFTPDATSVMSTGTVSGGKNGDTWVNTSGGNQVNVWAAGAWVPITWNAASVITANSITAGLMAAGIVVAGIVDATTITGSTIIDTGGGYFEYNGTPAAGNLVYSDAVTAGTDAHGNAYLAGPTWYGMTSSGNWIAVSAGVTNAAFGFAYYSATSEAGPWGIDSWLRRSDTINGQIEVGPLAKFIQTGLLPPTPADGATFFVPTSTTTPRVMKIDGEPGYGIGETVYEINATQTISAGWAVTIAVGGVSLSVPVLSGVQYFFEAIIFSQNTAVTTTQDIGFTGPAVSQCTWFLQTQGGSTNPINAAIGTGWFSTLTFDAIALAGASDVAICHAWGTFTPSANGTFAAGAGEGNSKSFHILAGSFLKVRTVH